MIYLQGYPQETILVNISFIGQAFKKTENYLFGYACQIVLQKCSNKPNLG